VVANTAEYADVRLPASGPSTSASPSASPSESAGASPSPAS
jgi:hypothetical protein